MKVDSRNVPLIALAMVVDVLAIIVLVSVLISPFEGSILFPVGIVLPAAAWALSSVAMDKWVWVSAVGTAAAYTIVVLMGVLPFIPTAETLAEWDRSPWRQLTLPFGILYLLWLAVTIVGVASHVVRLFRALIPQEPRGPVQPMKGRRVGVRH